MSSPPALAAHIAHVSLIKPLPLFLSTEALHICLWSPSLPSVSLELHMQADHTGQVSELRDMGEVAMAEMASFPSRPSA